MHLQIVNLNPFTVEFSLYNLLGEVDGHPKVRFDMATGDYDLYRDKTYANLVCTAPDSDAGQLITVTHPVMIAHIHAKVMERVRTTSFHDDWATRRFNPWNPGYDLDRNLPRSMRSFKRHSYLFFQLPRTDKGEFQFIGDWEYEHLERWYKKLPSVLKLDGEL